MSLDRRVKYTKMALKNSLIQLMKEKPISRITIKAICEGADINRTTFYAHYRDQYDQLDQIELSFIEGINVFLDSLFTETDTILVLERISDYVYANRDLCCTLLSPNGDMAFEKKVEQIIHHRVCLAWGVGQPEPDTAMDYSYTYIVNGSVGVIKKWLNTANNRKSSKEIAALLYELCYKGMRQMLANT